MTKGTAVSALPLTQDQLNQLQDKFAKILGDTVSLENRVDDELIGGVIVEIAGRLYDGSLRGQLNRLQAQWAK